MQLGAYAAQLKPLRRMPGRHNEEDFVSERLFFQDFMHRTQHDMNREAAGAAAPACRDP